MWIIQICHWLAGKMTWDNVWKGTGLLHKHPVNINHNSTLIELSDLIINFNSFSSPLLEMDIYNIIAVSIPRNCYQLSPNLLVSIVPLSDNIQASSATEQSKGIPGFLVNATSLCLPNRLKAELKSDIISLHVRPNNPCCTSCRHDQCFQGGMKPHNEPTNSVITVEYTEA